MRISKWQLHCRFRKHTTYTAESLSVIVCLSLGIPSFELLIFVFPTEMFVHYGHQHLTITFDGCAFEWLSSSFNAIAYIVSSLSGHFPSVVTSCGHKHSQSPFHVADFCLLHPRTDETDGGLVPHT